MSGVLWHREGYEAVRLSGCERAYMGCVCNDIALSFLPHGCCGALADLFPADQRYWVKSTLGQEESMRLCLRHSCDHLLVPGAEGVTQVQVFGMFLQTVVNLGSDVLTLMARLHGQCEIHAWVEPLDRPWLAGLIEAGRAANVLRPGMGWEAVAAMLREPDGSPVVTSYTVCESFPRLDYVPESVPVPDEDDERWQWWDKLDAAGRWALCMPELRKTSCRLDPAHWRDYRFYAGYTVQDLAQWASDYYAAREARERSER